MQHLDPEVETRFHAWLSTFPASVIPPEAPPMLQEVLAVETLMGVHQMEADSATGVQSILRRWS